MTPILRPARRRSLSDVNTSPCRARLTHAKHFLACGSRLKTFELHLLCAFLKQSSSRAHVMFHTMLDHVPFSLHHVASTSSLLNPPNRTNPCAPQSGLLFGRFAEQSPLTGYDPSAPVEVSSTEVTTTLLPSRKASIGSTHKSGEDIVTTLAVSEVDERSNLGMLASPLLSQERDKREPFRNFSL